MLHFLNQNQNEVHDHLHCFEHVQLQVVKTAPDSQLLNLLSVSRLVTVLDEADQCGVTCELQELDRGVFRCAVVRVQGEEQWGENTTLQVFQTSNITHSNRLPVVDSPQCWGMVFYSWLSLSDISTLMMSHWKIIGSLLYRNNSSLPL